MLNQNSININPDNQKPALTGEELDNIRKYEPCPLSPYNEEKTTKLRNKLLDILGGNKKNLLGIVNQILPDSYKQKTDGNKLFHAQITSWLETPDSEILRRPNRFSSELSTAELIEACLERFFIDQDDIKSKELVDPGFVETSVFKNIIRGFQIAREENCIIEISTYAGSGKTTAAKHYVKECHKSEGFNCPVYMITLTQSNVNSRLITWEICKAIIGHESGMFDIGSPDRKSEYEMNELIAERCSSKPGGLIIFDEAQLLGIFQDRDKNIGLKIFNGLRSYCDQGLFGIALLSNGEIYDRTKQSKNSTQLSSRIWPYKVDKLTVNDIDMIMASCGVSGKRERELSIKLGTDEKNGCLRNLIRAYRFAWRLYGEINFASMSSVIK